MSWADKTRCEHGLTFNQECERCEVFGIEESLKLMKRKVLKDEKRLAELQDKFTPDFLKQDA